MAKKKKGDGWVLDRTGDLAEYTYTRASPNCAAHIHRWGREGYEVLVNRYGNKERTDVEITQFVFRLKDAKALALAWMTIGSAWWCTDCPKGFTAYVRPLHRGFEAELREANNRGVTVQEHIRNVRTLAEGKRFVETWIKFIEGTR